mmetsp:Transcript_10769/g.44556  ORF Transcript_10769/g.44556 Transcript_10769/m.44556 type:complete len:220 (-) Transcript_10769:4588-5247(-)
MLAGRAALPLGHLALISGERRYLRLRVVVRRHLDQPVRLDLDDVAHVLLGGQHELEVRDPARHGLGEAAGRVDVHRLWVLDGAVVALPLELGRVIEEAGSDGAADGVVVLRARGHLHLRALAEPLHLVSDVARTLHGAQLHEVLHAPLVRVVGLGPLVVRVHEREVVARVALVEVLARVVRVDLLVLGRVEDAVSHREHRHDGDHFGNALLFVRRQHGL